jgi:putative transposase
VQLALAFARPGRGGARPGAGRKPGPHPKTPHRARPRHYFGHPVHVTLRAALGSLRSQLLYPTVRIAISLATRHSPDRFRIVHYSVQSNHLHLIVEAAERRSLSAGVHGLEIRITRYINRLLRRRGSFWADRWHGRALKSPREVRNALVYVLANFRKHASRPVPPGADPCSSSAWFHGWRGADAQHGARLDARAPPLARRAWPVPPTDEKVPVSEPRTWLLREGFLKAGRVRLDEAPRSDGMRRSTPRRTADAR